MRVLKLFNSWLVVFVFLSCNQLQAQERCSHCGAFLQRVGAKMHCPNCSSQQFGASAMPDSLLPLGEPLIPKSDVLGVLSCLTNYFPGLYKPMPTMTFAKIFHRAARERSRIDIQSELIEALCLLFYQKQGVNFVKPAPLQIASQQKIETLIADLPDVVMDFDYLSNAGLQYQFSQNVHSDNISEKYQALLNPPEPDSFVYLIITNNQQEPVTYGAIFFGNLTQAAWPAGHYCLDLYLAPKVFMTINQMLEVINEVLLEFKRLSGDESDYSAHFFKVSAELFKTLELTIKK